MSGDKKALPEVKKGPKCPECASGACPLCDGGGGACRLCAGTDACPVCAGTGVDPGPAVRARHFRALARTFLRLAAGADARASVAESEEARPTSSAEKGAPSMKIDKKSLPAVNASAEISPCGLYRYSLVRRWADGPRALFIMLNPSTADAEHDDPTIRRCVSFAKREGCGVLEVVNLFSYRATDPKDLVRTVHSPNGVYSNAVIAAAAKIATMVIAAWGGWIPKAWDVRPREVIHMIDRPVLALGVTSDGQPRHPLYVRGDAPLRPYELP